MYLAGFHKWGYPFIAGWLGKIMENPIKWMMTGGVFPV